MEYLELVLQGLPVKLSKKRELVKTAEKGNKELAEQLHECVFMLKRNEIMYNFEVDDDILDALIFEREAILCRHRSLIKQLKMARASLY